MLPSLDGSLLAKILRDRLIRSSYIDDQRILQSDWTRSTTGYTQQKVVVSNAAFP